MSDFCPYCKEPLPEKLSAAEIIEEIETAVVVGKPTSANKRVGPQDDLPKPIIQGQREGTLLTNCQPLTQPNDTLREALTKALHEHDETCTDCCIFEPCCAKAIEPVVRALIDEAVDGAFEARALAERDRRVREEGS